MNIVVLGSGCSKCHSTAGLIERVAKDLGTAVSIVLNESKEDRERLGVHATPAVLVDGKLVHSGGIPAHEKVEVWLRPKPLGLLTQPTRHLFFTGNIAVCCGGPSLGGLRSEGAVGQHRLCLQSR